MFKVMSCFVQSWERYITICPVCFPHPLLFSCHGQLPRGDHIPPERINILPFLFMCVFQGIPSPKQVLIETFLIIGIVLMHNVLLDLHDTGKRWHRFWSPPIDNKLRTVLLESSGLSATTQYGSFKSRVLSFTCSLLWFGSSTKSCVSWLSPCWN